MVVARWMRRPDVVADEIEQVRAVRTRVGGSGSAGRGGHRAVGGLRVAALGG